MIGQQVGDFTVLRPLGEQAMGTVYLGEHRVLKQKVAIKALDPKLSNAAGMRERFEREAQTLARLNHPSITRLQNFYSLPSGCFIVMEFSEGETLEAMLEEKGPLPPRDVARWTIDILRGLAYAHQNGVIHRDLKPGNIIVTAVGAKILDFGLSKVTEGPKLTMQGLTLGTMYYMSREQLLGKTVDARSDIYSVGATLYEVITGKLPFWDEDEQKLILKIAKQDAPAPSTVLPTIPKELERIIVKALSRDPAQRYQTADDMVRALEAFLAVEDAPAPAPAPPPAKPTTARRVAAAPPPSPSPPVTARRAPMPAPSPSPPVTKRVLAEPPASPAPTGTVRLLPEPLHAPVSLAPREVLAPPPILRTATVAPVLEELPTPIVVPPRAKTRPALPPLPPPAPVPEPFFEAPSPETEPARAPIVVVDSNEAPIVQDEPIEKAERTMTLAPPASILAPREETAEIAPPIAAPEEPAEVATPDETAEIASSREETAEVAPAVEPQPPYEPAAPAAAVAIARPGRFSGLLVAGAVVLAATVGLGATVLVSVPEQKLLPALVFGMGLPVGIVLFALGTVDQMSREPS